MTPPKLTLELIPSSSWFDNLRSQLPKETWDTLRRASYRAARYRCQICGGKGPDHPVECHERWNFDHLNHVQKLEGLIALCPACHAVKHFGLACLRGEQDAAEKHLMKVNHWTRAQMLEHVAQSFATWEEYSTLEWSLDLSWLESL